MHEYKSDENCEAISTGLAITVSNVTTSRKGMKLATPPNNTEVDAISERN